MHTLLKIAEIVGIIVGVGIVGFIGYLTYQFVVSDKSQMFP